MSFSKGVNASSVSRVSDDEQVDMDDTIPADTQDDTQLVQDAVNLDEETQQVDNSDCHDDLMMDCFTEVRTQLVDEGEDGAGGSVVSDSADSDSTHMMIRDDGMLSDEVVYPCKVENPVIVKDKEADREIPQRRRALEFNGCKRGVHGDSINHSSRLVHAKPMCSLVPQDEYAERVIQNRSFTAIRLASLRASAAKCDALANGAQNDPDTFSTRSRVEQKQDEAGAGAVNRIARKLFGENLEIASDFDAKADDLFSEMHASEHDVPGLSYIGSQEPGELTQDNALGVVDKLVGLEELGLFQDDGKHTHSEGKLTSASGMKGVQRLARKSDLVTPFEKSRTYDWVDGHEEDGGGFFSRNKEILFRSKDGKKSSSEHHKSRKSSANQYDSSIKYLKQQKSIQCRGSSQDKENGANMAQPCGLQADASEVKKILFGVLDKEENAENVKPRVMSDNCDMNVSPTYDVGVDTQMAADALQTLGLELHNSVSKKYELSGLSACSGKRSSDFLETSWPKKQKRTCKRIISATHEANSREQQEKRKTKRAKRSTDQSNGDVNLSVQMERLLDLQSEKRRMEVGDLDEKCATNSSVDDEQTTGRTYCMEMEYKPSEVNMGSETCMWTEPVACRTRNSTATKYLKRTQECLVGLPRKESSQQQIFGAKSSSDGAPNQSHFVQMENLAELGNNRKVRQTSKRASVNGVNSLSNSTVDNLKNVSGKISGSSTGKVRRKGRDITSDFPVRVSAEISPVLHRRQSETKNQQQLSKEKESSPVGAAVKVTEGNAEYPLTHEINTRPSDSKGSPSSPTVKKARKCFSRLNTGHTQKGTSLLNEEMHGEVPIASVSKPYNAMESNSAFSTPIKDVSIESPVCVANSAEKHSHVHPRTTSLRRELIRLDAMEPEISPVLRDSGKRKKILFSRHLSEAVIKRQKKIVDQFGISKASSAADATHFVADMFVRTKNMLEAIAIGLPIVTPSWLEGCSRAGCLTDENQYILKDKKKEMEIGFSLCTSLSLASKKPLLQGHRVLVTPNVKPSREVIIDLVKAAHGQVIDRTGRSRNVNLLLISCEDDRPYCDPYITKGMKAYSSELILNGIVIQKLEYERHLLFGNNVKRTRSTFLNTA